VFQKPSKSAGRKSVILRLDDLTVSGSESMCLWNAVGFFLHVPYQRLDVRHRRIVSLERGRAVQNARKESVLLSHAS
jgi:hypothetical protein